ncbi:MAG: TMEM199/VMA12 family vacuolar ATPase assembly factor [Gemmatimonadota bacterium]|nr:TMEM199/VMA12 family vacuolar ATPase assembly factor [Gemmatimonadota bacterium]
MTDHAPDLPKTQPWAALALGTFVLNWIWEMLQAPLYASMQGMARGKATWLCTVASGGDVVIMLVAYSVVALLVGSGAWFLHPRPGRVAIYLAAGLLITVAAEMLSIHWWGRWSYGPSMPLLLGVGVSPLAQWVVVPLIMLWVAKRYLRRGAVERLAAR